VKQWLARLLTLAATLTLLTPAFASVKPGADHGWQLRKDQAGIRIYTRPDPNSPLDEFKGITEFNTSLSSLVQLIRDTQNTKRWMHRSGGTTLLETVHVHEQVLHTITRSPWPVSDRDVVLRAMHRQHPETRIITITLESIENQILADSDYVRMPHLHGTWIFTPTNNGVIEVRYQMSADPGGSIPAWLAASSSIDMPFITLQNMRKILSEKVYRFAVVEDVVEP